MEDDDWRQQQELQEQEEALDALEAYEQMRGNHGEKEKVGRYRPFKLSAQQDRTFDEWLF